MPGKTGVTASIDCCLCEQVDPMNLGHLEAELVVQGQTFVVTLDCDSRHLLVLVFYRVSGTTKP